MADTKPHTNSSLIRLFQSRLPDLAPETALKYRRTILEIDCFFSSHSLRIADIDEAMTADFAIDLLSRNLSPSTVARHLNILSGLLKTAAAKNLLSPTDAPRIISRTLSQKDFKLPPMLNATTLPSILPIIRKAFRGDTSSSTYLDILLTLLLNPTLSFKDITLLKKQDISRFDDTTAMILARNSSPSRSFIFDLRQSYLTPAQLRNEAKKAFGETFGKITGMTQPDPDTFAASLWTLLAMQCGARASEAAACLPLPPSYSLPQFGTAGATNPVTAGVAGASHPEAKVIDAWQTAVATFINSSTPRWYAMHLRRGVAYDDLRRDIAEKVSTTPELYYPFETIRKKIGEKTVYRDRPFISDTVFFRTGPERVAGLFHAIGDKAWCYRLTASPSSPYAVIPQGDMRRFQAAVGIFTPGTEIVPAGQLTPRPGEPVIVIKPGYSGRQGKIEEVIKSQTGTAIFRVTLTTDAGYEWRLEATPAEILKIEN